MKNMAQAKEKNTISENHFLIQSQALEELKTQGLGNIPARDKDESQSIEKKSRKLFGKIKFKVRKSEEKVSIQKYKAQLDTKLLGARNSMINF